MKSQVAGSAVLVQVVMLTFLSFGLYVLLHSYATTVAIASLRYTQEREQQASHGLFLYGVAHAQKIFGQLKESKPQMFEQNTQWPEVINKQAATITLTKEKNTISIESDLVLKEKTIKERGTLQRLLNGQWQVANWRMSVESA